MDELQPLENKEINSLSLILTQRCNLRCDYCYLLKKNIDMSEETACKSVDFFLKSSGREKRIIFLGGEPSLKIDLVGKIGKYIDFCKDRYSDKKILKVINTNGFFLNKKIMEAYRNFDLIAVSLDGKEEAHNIGRKSGGKDNVFQRTVKNFKSIKKAYPEKIAISKVVSSQNYKTFASDILFLFSLEPAHLFIGVAYGDQGWTKEKIKHLFFEADKINFAIREEKKENGFRKTFDLFLKKLKKECVLGYLAVSPAGGFYPCEILANKELHCLGDVENGFFDKSLVDCSYSCRNKRCKNELCRRCDNICFSFDFAKGGRAKSARSESVFYAKKAHSFLQYFKNLEVFEKK